MQIPFKAVLDNVNAVAQRDRLKHSMIMCYKELYIHLFKAISSLKYLLPRPREEWSTDREG